MFFTCGFYNSSASQPACTGYRKPPYNVTFGEGPNNPGPLLSLQNTSFNYTTDTCPAPGYYTITNSLYRCAATRIGRSIDNTAGSNSGYMMIVNDTAASNSKILFVDTIKEALCAGTLYQFSAAIINTEIPTYCNSLNVRLPQFTLTIETTTGQVLQSANTGPVPFSYNLTRVTMGEIKSWEWTFGNNFTSVLRNPPVQNYSIDNNTSGYLVSLAVMDTAGCTDTIYHPMKVVDNCYIAVPSAFTPNGDGLNDYLYPVNAYKATHLVFKVFNRKGQLMFETRDWTKKWDGTFKGNPFNF